MQEGEGMRVLGGGIRETGIGERKLIEYLLGNKGTPIGRIA